VAWTNETGLGNHVQAMLLFELLGRRTLFDKALSYVRLQ
jgi:hypothetical protein